MASAVPVRNVYFLLCYAWNRLTERGLADVASEGTTELADLFARVLISGTARLRKRGFERGYAPCTAELAGVRGRILLLETVRHFLDHHGRTTCEFDELTFDTPQNQVLKAAMRTLCAAQELDGEHRTKLKRLIRELKEVSDRPLGRSLFREVRLHTNNRHYGLLIDVASLIWRCVIPDEATGSYRFRDFTREGPEMARLFEAFVRNFLKIERPDLSIGSEELLWTAVSQDDPQLIMLPRMRTDITVRSADRTLVIDTKFYENTLQTYFDKRSVHSAHLYQLLTYLRSMEKLGATDTNAEGMLLYPVTSDPIDLRYEIEGHKVRVRTIDLSKEWRNIADDVRSLF